MSTRTSLIVLFLMSSTACRNEGKAEPAVDLKSQPAVMAEAAAIGQPAPDFTLVSTDGKSVRLKGYLGKVVILEWFNPDCPFVKVAHGEGKLGKRASAHIADGGVWLAVNSGAPGLQGAGKVRNVKARAEYGLAYPVLLDESGVVGKTYGATRTPHIYVIDAKGILVYAGALDSTRGAGYTGEKIDDYLGEALAAVKAGRAVKTAQTKSWGCSVKYAR